MISKNDINRFITAQQNIYTQVLKELQNEKKTSHWMWFIFPQIEGLGMSPTSQFYAIKNIEEAKDYLAHPVLGARLIECSNILLGIKNKSAYEILGSPDDAKLKSCMTLFNYINPEEKVFEDILQKYYGGNPDEKTLSILKNIS